MIRALPTSRWKELIRPVLFAALRALLSRTRDAGFREAIFRRIRRVDDRFDTFSRRLLKERYDIDVGRYTYGAYRIDGSIAPHTTIGSFCSIAPSAVMGGTDHPLTYVSTHPFLYLANRGFVTEDDDDYMREVNAPIVVEDDVWIGVNALLLPGVHVARGAVVAAGAVVTRDVPPYAIVAGVPARVVRHRVDEQRAERLLRIDWPGWSDATIRERLDGFYDVDVFLERFGDAG